MLPMYFIVDTNIIIAYIKHENSPLTAFIEDTKNKFYYTETVKKEIGTRHKIPKLFNFVDSTLDQKRKDDAFQELGISNIKMINDLFIIFEAGFICYSITELDDFNEPILLTNNLVLHKKYIARPIRKQELENIINLYGFEHLINVCTPMEVIPGY